jgi:hypothetical protein
MLVDVSAGSRYPIANGCAAHAPTAAGRSRSTGSGSRLRCPICPRSIDKEKTMALEIRAVTVLGAGVLGSQIAFQA